MIRPAFPLLAAVPFLAACSPAPDVPEPVDRAPDDQGAHDEPAAGPGNMTRSGARGAVAT